MFFFLTGLIDPTDEQIQIQKEAHYLSSQASNISQPKHLQPHSNSLNHLSEVERTPSSASNHSQPH